MASAAEARCDVPETSAAIIAYGVLAGGNFSSLSAKYQTDLTSAVVWLLGQQDTTAPSAPFGIGGSWSFSSSDQTYSTGLALSALSFSSIVPGQAAAVATAITNGRAWLVNNFQGLGNETCTTAGAHRRRRGAAAGATRETPTAPTCPTPDSP